MLKNDVKIAFRHYNRQKILTIINVLGLTIGIGAFILISLYVFNELSFDSTFPQSRSIFRITTTNVNDGTLYAKCQESIAPVVTSSSQVESVTRFKQTFGVITRVNQQLFLEQGTVYYADRALFDIFDLTLVAGNQGSIFQSPQDVVISQQTAIKYFGEINVVGEIITLDDQQKTICGVLQEIPDNCHLPKLKLILPYEGSHNPDTDEWVPTYVKLIDMDHKDSIEAWLNMEIHQPISQSESYPYSLVFQSIRDIHLGEKYIAEYSVIGNKKQLYVFSSIAFLILVIACLNFINLTTVLSFERFKEIGIRKVVGALRSALVRQFLVEVTILTLFAFALALFIIDIILSWSPHLFGKQLNVAINQPFLWIFSLFSLVFITFFSGIYPSAYFASLRPIQILRSRTYNPYKKHKSNVRNIFVVCQFVGSITLIAASLIIYRQLDYMKSKNLGFHQDRMLVIPTQTQKMASLLKNDIETIKNSFSQHSNVQSITAHLASPGRIWRMEFPTLVETSFSPQFPFTWEFVDFDYIKTYELNLLFGRNFDIKYSADFGHSIIINETATKVLGFSSPEQALGKNISTWMGQSEIVGILKDFHFQALHKKIEPIMISVMPGFFPESMTLRLGSGDLAETLIFLESKWKELFPNFPFEYYFIDRDFASNYQSDEQFAKIIVVFTSLALFIACLGLFGLIYFAAVHQTKEIGIRKILGATIYNIFIKLSGQFIKWIVIASLFAWPISWILMNRWLQNFAYRTEMNWWIFMMAGFSALIISMITISLHVIKASKANPVKALRYE